MWGSRTWILFGFCVVVAVAGLRIAVHKAEPPPFEARVYASTGGARMRYRLYVPPNYDPHKTYPLVIWLHGYDAVGNDNLAQITGYNDAGTRVWTTPEHWKKFSTLVVAPQSYERYWSMSPSPLPAEEPLVLGIVATIEKEFSIDSDRVYLAGQSMGGFGVWAFLEHRPDLYAAGIVLCGPVNREMQSQATRIAHIPVRVFQGGKDDVVSIEDARAMVELLRKAGGQPHYTRVPESRSPNRSHSVRRKEPAALAFRPKAHHPPRDTLNLTQACPSSWHFGECSVRIAPESRATLK